MLVEDPSCRIDVIDVNFLIVGHTHASIDQYFSVLSNKIEHVKFVGTPAGMMWLLAHAHTVKSEMRPLLPPRRIDVVYDVKQAFQDGDFLFVYHHYQTPHVFRFEKIAGSGKCGMRYKLFSSYVEWLPLPPTSTSNTEPTEDLVSTIMVEDQFSAVGGLSRLLDDCNVSTASAQASLASSGILSEIRQMEDTFAELNQSVMLPSFNKDQQYGDAQEHVSYVQDFKDRWSTKGLRARSTKQCGYIIWLKQPCNVCLLTNPDPLSPAIALPSPALPRPAQPCPTLPYPTRLLCKISMSFWCVERASSPGMF